MWPGKLRSVLPTHTAMSTNGKTMNRWAIGIGVVLLLGATSAAVIYREDIGQLTHDLNGAKLRSELLLSEKLQLEKDIAGLQSRLADMTEQEAASTRRAGNAERITADAVKRAQDYLARARHNDGLQREVAQLRAVKQDLEAHAAAADMRLAALQQENEQLRGTNNALNEQLALNARGAAMVNNGLLEAVKGGKGRLTVVARRTRDIRMAFDLPEGLSKDVSFKVITPDGKSYEGSDPRISMEVEAHVGEPMASTLPLVDGTERSARVHFHFKPEERLRPGTYRIDIRSGEQYLGTAQVRLR